MHFVSILYKKKLVDLKYGPWLEIKEWQLLYGLARAEAIISLFNENSTVIFLAATLFFISFLQISSRNVICSKALSEHRKDEK
jgi:hypothetical protein